MKRLVTMVVCALVLTCGTMCAQQRHAVGGYALPIGNHREWLSDRPEDLVGKALLVEFVHTANSRCREDVEKANEWAHTYNNILNVVMVTREPAEQVVAVLMHEYQYAYVALDEQGTIYRKFEVPHVPYAVLLSPQGGVLWMGNPANLNGEMLEQLLDVK